MDGSKEKQDIEALLAAGQSVQFAPDGWSMYPLLESLRDQVVVVPIGERPLRRGDVALYRRDGGILVLHRVWRANARGLWFVGDNQKEIEGPLRPDQVRGVMTAMIRKGKRVEVTDLRYRVFSALWLLLRPIRPFIAKIVHALK